MYLAGYGLQKSVFAIIVQSLPHDDVDEEVGEKVDDEVGKEEGRWRRKKLGDEVEKGGGDQSVLPVIGRGVPPPLPYLQLPQSHLTPVQRRNT